MKTLLILTLFIGATFSILAQPSYEAFRETYKPHYNTTIDKSETKMWDAINTLNNTSAQELGDYLKGLYGSDDQNDLLIMARILTNCKRDLIGQSLDAMALEDAEGTLSKMNGEWQKELLYFVSKKTYHALVKSFAPLKDIQPKNSNLPSLNDEMDETYSKKINTEFSELLPTVTPDGKKIFFARDEDPRNAKGGVLSQDIWVANIENGIDEAIAYHMEYPFNQATFNSVAGVSPDGNTLLINGKYKNGILEGRGYSMVKKTASGYSTPEGIDIKNYADYSKGRYAGAFLASDMQTILMYMSPEGDQNNNDLFVSFKLEDGSWSEPKNLGNTINNEHNQLSPFLASDQKTLYYSTNQPGGKGSNDIWVAKRLDDSWTNWSEPKNLGGDVNTTGWDAYYSVDAQGEYAYMVSDRNSISENIIRIKLEQEDRPDPVVLIRGKVFNAKTKEPLEAMIEYEDISDGKKYGITYSDPKSGDYTIVLPYGKNYGFNALADNFIAVSDNIDITEVGGYKEITRDLYMVPIEVGETVLLNNIFFETNKATLKSASHAELNRIKKIMDKNPQLKIEISGHTDNVGDKTYNQNLSLKRAQAVLDYLKSKGVEPNRLSSKGYGMDKPVADNTTEEGRAKNRRVEFTIIEK